MAGYYSDSCNTIVPAHSCDPCGPKESGKIGSAAWVRKDYYSTLAANPENASLWIAGQESGAIIVIPETSGGELADPSPIEGKGYGRQKIRITGFDYTATIYDPSYAENCDHYNALLLSNNYHFVYVTSSKLHITQVPVTIIPTAPVLDDVTSEVDWKVVVRWSYNQHPCPVDIPAGVFDECFIPDPE